MNLSRLCSKYECTPTVLCVPCNKQAPSEVQLYIPSFSQSPGHNCRCDGWVGSWILPAKLTMSTGQLTDTFACVWELEITGEEAANFEYHFLFTPANDCRPADYVRFRLWPGLGATAGFPNHRRWEIMVTFTGPNFTAFHSTWIGPELDDPDLAPCVSWEDVEFSPLFVDQSVCSPDTMYISAL